MSSVPLSETNPNILSLAQPIELGGRTGDSLTGHTGGASTMRSQSWMNTLSSASSVSKKSSGGPASKLSMFFNVYFHLLDVHCALLFRADNVNCANLFALFL